METPYLECKRLEAKIKTHTLALKELREKLKTQKVALYEGMKAKKRDEYKGYTLDALSPKPKVNAKVVREQKEENIKHVLSTSGVHNPNEVLTKIKDIQRPKKKKS